MSRLIALYPARWRERYGEELLDALSAGPLTMRGRLDLVRGALDAHRHPELIPGDPLPVPVGGAMGGAAPASRHDGLELFAAAAATAAFWVAAILVMVESRRYGGASLQGALLLIGIAALAWVTWDRAGRSRVVGLCGAASVLGGVALIQAGWPSQPLDPSARLLLLALMVAIGGFGFAAALLPTRARAWTVRLPMLLTALLGVGYVLSFTRGVAMVLLSLGLVSVCLVVPTLTVRRAGAAGAAVVTGVLIVALVSITAAATSTWVPYQGYLLACHVERTICRTVADRTVQAIVAEHPAAEVTHLEIMADSGFQACWTAPVESDRGCWFTSQYTGNRP